MSAQKTTFIDCKTGSGIEDLIVFSNNVLLGYTDSNGTIELKGREPIFLSGINIRDTTINKISSNTICLQSQIQDIPEFEVVDSKVDLKALCSNMLINSHKLMRKKDTTITYRFEHKLTIPDSGWSETLKGILVVKIEMLSKKNAQGKVLVCEIERSAIPEWSETIIYQSKFNTLGLFSLIQQDFMFAHQKKIDERFQKVAKEVNMRKQNQKTQVEIKLGGTEISTVFKSKEIHFYNEKALKRIEYYNVKTDTTYAGINKFYKEVMYSDSFPSFIKSLLYKSIMANEGTFFIHEFRIMHSDKVAEDCLKKKIDFGSNYMNWNN